MKKRKDCYLIGRCSIFSVKSFHFSFVGKRPANEKWNGRRRTDAKSTNCLALNFGDYPPWGCGNDRFRPPP